MRWSSGIRRGSGSDVGVVVGGGDGYGGVRVDEWSRGSAGGIGKGVVDSDGGRCVGSGNGGGSRKRHGSNRWS